MSHSALLVPVFALLLAPLAARAGLVEYEVSFEIVSANPSFEVPEGFNDPVVATGVTQRVVHPASVQLPSFFPDFPGNYPLDPDEIAFAFLVPPGLGADIFFHEIDVPVSHLTLIGGTAALADPSLPVRGRVGLVLSPGPIAPLTAGSGATGVGVGGPTLIQTTPTTTLRRLSIQGAPWTVHGAQVSEYVGTGTAVAFSSVGFAHGPLSGTASALDPGGTLRVVTPIQMRVEVGTLLAPIFVRGTGFFGRLEVRIVPEPGLALPLLLGCVLLLFLARRRVAGRRLRSSS